MVTLREDRRMGIIATLADGAVVHALGSRRDALRDIATVCDERGVKVRSLSTAQTIESDLHGPREHVGNGRRRDDPHGAPAVVVFPEPALLSLIGRADLFEREVGRGAAV